MFKILKHLSGRDKILIFAVLVLTCTQTYLDLSLPDYMSKITMLVQTHGSEMDDILWAGGKMLGCALGSMALSIVVAVIAAYVATGFSHEIRGKIFEKVMDFSLVELKGFSPASLITRTTNDVTQVQLIMAIGMQVLFKAPITAVWAIIKIANKNMSWTIVTAIAVVVLLGIVGICLGLAVPRFKKLQVLTDHLNRVARENLEGLSVVRAYNAEQYQENKFEGVNQEYFQTHLFTARAMSFLMPSIQMIANGVVLGVYLVGAIMINEAIGMDKLSLFSDMVVFSSYAMQVIIAFMMLVFVFMQLPRASVSAKRMNEVLETTNSLEDGELESDIEDKIGEIEFKNVSFKYPDGEEAVLKNISFKVKSGEVLAFIGSTGCGKSTLINLIPRFYDVTQGEVLVNGRNVKSYKKSALMNKIGYISQKATLFSGTIKNNVEFGDAKENEGGFSKAIQTAQAQDFVSHLEKQENAIVAQGGKNLSGGQRQRVSIARAIYKSPPIYIFDDSFSALDYKTDRKLREALDVECKDATRIIVGQRIGTIRDADQIIVLDAGEIVGMGKHEDLLKTCEVYKQIGLSQLSEEELA